MRDPLTSVQRSALMAKVRSKENRSTEAIVEAVLIREKIKGWVKHPRGILGRPDFYFPHPRLAVFVDGCFWHACPTCRRRTPTKRKAFWSQKIIQNRRRDTRIRRRLRIEGYHAMRIWEHELRTNRWLDRLHMMLQMKESSRRKPYRKVLRKKIGSG